MCFQRHGNSTVVTLAWVEVFENTLALDEKLLQRTSDAWSRNWGCKAEAVNSLAAPAPEQELL